MKKRILKILIIAILIVLLLYIVNCTRNFIILNNLKEKINKLEKLDTYSLIIKSNNEETEIVKNKNIIKIEKNDSDTIVYFNSDTNEMIEENISTGEKELYSDKIATVNLNLLEIKEEFWKNIFTSIITTTNIKGEKCYKIKLNDIVYYVSADTGLRMKAVDKNANETVEYFNS